MHAQNTPPPRLQLQNNPAVQYINTKNNNFDTDNTTGFTSRAGGARRTDRESYSHGHAHGRKENRQRAKHTTGPHTIPRAP